MVQGQPQMTAGSRRETLMSGRLLDGFAPSTLGDRQPWGWGGVLGSGPADHLSRAAMPQALGHTGKSSL